ncbi:MAG: molybdenum cofactor guanylyltransferase MobA [Usitatibacteraceae bacterium]
MTPTITGLILAGGRGSRMGSVDKGLQPFKGEPMVAHVLARFAPQVDEILINANRSLDEYSAFGHRVIPDAIDGFAGPLAGLQIGMKNASHPLVATAPCDSPFLPLDLIARLAEAMQQANADLAVAKTFDQPHPVFCLVKTSLAPHLQAFLESGQRKIDKWYATLKVVEVQFDDEEAAFSNINTVEELKAFEQTK